MAGAGASRADPSYMCIVGGARKERSECETLLCALCLCRMLDSDGVVASSLQASYCAIDQAHEPALRVHFTQCDEYSKVVQEHANKQAPVGKLHILVWVRHLPAVQHATRFRAGRAISHAARMHRC